MLYTTYMPPPPHNIEARRIWDECSLGDYASCVDVKGALSEWIYFNTEMREQVNHRNEIELCVKWAGLNGITFKMTWTAMLRWFHFSCKLLEG